MCEVTSWAWSSANKYRHFLLKYFLKNPKVTLFGVALWTQNYFLMGMLNFLIYFDNWSRWSGPTIYIVCTRIKMTVIKWASRRHQLFRMRRCLYTKTTYVYCWNFHQKNCLIICLAACLSKAMQIAPTFRLYEGRNYT